MADLAHDTRAELDAVAQTAQQQGDNLKRAVDSKDAENTSLHQRLMQEKARSAALEDNIRYAWHTQPCAYRKTAYCSQHSECFSRATASKTQVHRNQKMGPTTSTSGPTVLPTASVCCLTMAAGCAGSSSTWFSSRLQQQRTSSSGM